MADPKQDKIENPNDAVTNDQGELSEADVENVAGGTALKDGGECCRGSSCDPSD